MRKIVYMYLATGVATEANEDGYPPGEKHSMLIFLAGYSENYDWKAAEQVATQRHWRDVEFGKAGRITTEQVAAQDRTIRESYADALEQGSALVVYGAAEPA